MFRQTHNADMLVMQQNHSFCQVLSTSKKKRTKPKTTKISKQSPKKCMFCGTSILKALRTDFGRVLGSQNLRFSQFFREKMEAKNKMIFGRLKNRILRPQEQIADEVRRSVRIRGKEQKDRGRPLS